MVARNYNLRPAIATNWKGTNYNLCGIAYIYQLEEHKFSKNCHIYQLKKNYLYFGLHSCQPAYKDNPMSWYK